MAKSALDRVILREDGDYLISFDRDRLDIYAIHAFLSTAYWSQNIPLATVAEAIKGSLPVGIYGPDSKQIGFARLITDFATFAYLADVYVLEGHRGKGLSKAMMQAIMELPCVKKIRRFLLATSDAHGLYEQFGFKGVERPEIFMEINQPNIYLNHKQ
jgi:GNAT superfamily N-acetyltransferase